MHVEDDVYGSLEDLMTREEFEGEVEDLSRRFGGLVSRDVLARVVANRHGRYEPTPTTVSMLAPGTSVTLRVRVREVGDIKEFGRRDGGKGRICSIELEDDTGTVKLALWGGEVELVKDLGLEPGHEVVLVDCYVKDGRYGIELGLGRSGSLSLAE